MKLVLIILAIIAGTTSELFSPDKFKGISPMITGGSPASQGQFPYQVAVAVQFDNYGIFCGGALIKHKWVLTTATCLQMRIVYYLVVFGSLNLLEDKPVFIHNSTLSSNIRIHPEYNNVTNVNNIALIYIDDMPASLTDHVNVGYISLPTEDEAKTNLTGRDIVISGYGLISDETKIDLIMHHTTVKLTSNDVCKNVDFNPGRYNVTDSSLCIDTTGGKSPCGDLGGPMTIEIGSKKVLVGIIGLEPFPCTVGYPVIADSVFYHREWIEKISGASEIALSLSVLMAVIIMTLQNLF